jgi:hypothetical protein
LNSTQSNLIRFEAPFFSCRTNEKGFVFFQIQQGDFHNEKKNLFSKSAAGIFTFNNGGIE